MSSNIHVVVRVRPLSADEENGDGAVIKCFAAPGGEVETGVAVEGARKPPGEVSTPPEVFEFGRVFDAGATQAEVYDATAARLVERVFEGRNATVMAYGQTGSGKTHSVTGPGVVGGAAADEGLIPRVCDDLFARARALEAAGASVAVVTRNYEIYNEQVRDLYADEDRPLRVQVDAHGQTHVDATEIAVASAADARSCVAVGFDRRVAARGGTYSCSTALQHILDDRLRV